MRADGETPIAFLTRLRRGDGAMPDQGLPGPGAAPAFAALYRGDLELPSKSVCYALFRESQAGVIAASELIA